MEAHRVLEIALGSLAVWVAALSGGVGAMARAIGLELTVLELYERSLVTSVSLKDSLALNRCP